MIIHQEIQFKCSAQSIFKALTNVEKFAEFTGVPAEIDFAVGGKFICFDKMISGIIIEFEPEKRLVQAWRVFNWDAGIIFRR